MADHGHVTRVELDHLRSTHVGDHLALLPRHDDGVVQQPDVDAADGLLQSGQADWLPKHWPGLRDHAIERQGCLLVVHVVAEDGGSQVAFQHGNRIAAALGLVGDRPHGRIECVKKALPIGRDGARDEHDRAHQLGNPPHHFWQRDACHRVPDQDCRLIDGPQFLDDGVDEVPGSHRREVGGSGAPSG